MALVPADELGRLGGHEQGHDRADERVVAVGADRRGLGERLAAGGLAREADDTHGDDRREDREAAEGDRRDLGATAAADPVARAERVTKER